MSLTRCNDTRFGGIPSPFLFYRRTHRRTLKSQHRGSICPLLHLWVGMCCHRFYWRSTYKDKEVKVKKDPLNICLNYLFYDTDSNWITERELWEHCKERAWTRWVKSSSESSRKAVARQSSMTTLAALDYSYPKCLLSYQSTKQALEFLYLKICFFVLNE